ncbi:peptidase S8 [Lactobacillus helveticus]|uniref:S8 family serine peptidase n=1 Tax=Lactobacillus helveticus TaxID=1587 RepID=UPI001C1E419E|nr:S8 family serine peptidase [Lactobacillus helveticus]MBU5980942.1 S8 family serine peptidase [Lactobacillus helveticus]MCT3414430.1 peptidase S8 [Lactobacillus helveticus]
MERSKYVGTLLCAATLSCISAFTTAENNVKASVESQTKSSKKAATTVKTTTTGVTQKAIEAQLAAKGVAFKHLTPKQKQDVYVDVIIQLKSAPAATNGSIKANASSAEIEQASKQVIASQSTVKSQVKAITKQAIGKSYGYVVNGFATKAKVKDIQKLRNLPGVKSVTLAKVYYVNDSSADDMANVSTVWNNYKYKGQGTVVSIIDTGIDPNHKDLRLSDDKQAKLSQKDVADFTKKAGYGRYFTDKVPYGHNYADNNEKITDDDPSEQHGMHVSGIVAANGTSNDAKSVVGVAPEAQLLAMKVFSNSDSSATTDSTSIVGAIDDSAKLHADVLNMSLGSTSGEQTGDDPEIAAVDRATKEGTAAVISAGNAGTTNSESEGNNKAYYGNPDMETVGNPGTARSATTVASAENTKITTSGITIKSADGETTILGPEITELSDGTDKTFFNNKQFYVVKGKDGKLGLGYADQYTSDVKGKIAIVKRGDLSFTDKQKFAEKAGAAGLIVINNEAGPLTMVQYNADFPTAGLSDTAGAALVKYVEGHPNEALKVNIEVQPLANTTTKSDLMSSFTSYGPVSNLAFKPDISAPGGNIWSTQNNNGYTNMSGTSMASPFIAGTQALITQAMSDKKGPFYDLYQKMSASEKTAFVKNIEMNTASIEPDVSHGNVIVSPRRQGAGLINAQAAINAIANNPSTVAAGNNYPAVELKDFKENTKTFTVKFTNRTNKPLTYELANNGKDSDVYTSATDENAVLYDEKINGASVKVNGSIEVPANSTKEVSLTLKLPNGFKENQYVEGFLTFKSSDNESQLRLPYMGFYGDWASNDIPIFAELNDKNVFHPDQGIMGTTVTVGNDSDNTNPGLNMDEMDENEYSFDSSKFAISTAKDSKFKWIKPTYYLYRNANNVKIQILNNKGEVINTLATLANVTKTYYYDQGQTYTYFDSAPSWDGTYFDQQKGEKVSVPEGSYVYRIVATVDGTNKQQHYDIPVKVDNTKPAVRNLKLVSTNTKDAEGKEQTKYVLTAEAKDELSGLSGDANVSVNGIFSQVQYDPTVKAGKDGFKQVMINLTDAQAKSLAAGKNDYSVALFDNASNAGTTSGEGNKPGESTYGLVLDNGGLPEKISSKTDNYDAKSDNYTVTGTYPAQLYGTYTDKDHKTHDLTVKYDETTNSFETNIPVAKADYDMEVEFYADEDHKTPIEQKNIAVSLVPAKVESLAVDGTESYDGKTTKLAQTSEGSVKLTGKVSADTNSIEIKNGDQKVPAELAADHTFSAEVPVEYGENDVTIVTADADGNKSTVTQKVKSSDRGKITVASGDVTFDNDISWGTTNVNAKTKNYDSKTGKLTITGKVKRPTTTLQIDGKDVKINPDQTFKLTLDIGKHGAKVFSALVGDSTVKETSQERLSFYVDANAPALNLNGKDTVYTTKDKFTISGTVSDDYKFYDLAINDNDVESNWSDVDYHSTDGVEKGFKHEVELKPGKNVFEVKVTDVQGNSSKQTLTVYYEPAKTLDNPVIKQVKAKDGKSSTITATTQVKDAKVEYSTDNGKTFKPVPTDGVKVTKNETMKFKAVDKYGNESEIVSVEVTGLNEKPTKPEVNQEPTSNPQSTPATPSTNNDSDKKEDTDKEKSHTPAEIGEKTTVMYKSVLYTKDLEKTDKVVSGYGKLNLVTDENGKLKVYTNKGQHFYKVVDSDEYVRVRNVTGTKVTLKRNSFVYESNGKRVSRKLLKKGTKVTVYGGKYKAIKHYRKTAYRIGHNKYVKSVNIKKFKPVE